MSARNTFLAFLGGAAIGAAVGILFAPAKGEVTRRRIGRAVEDGKDKVVDTFEHGRDAIVDAYHKGRERLSEAIADGRQMMQDELETICDSAEKAARNAGKKR